MSEDMRLRLLQDEVTRLRAEVGKVRLHNERLADTLREARDQIVTLRAEVDRLAQPPASYGTVLALHDDATADVATGGRKLRVAVSPELGVEDLAPGREVLLNEALNAVQAAGYERVGELVTIKEMMPPDRVLVVAHADEERVGRLAAPLVGSPLRVGDSLMMDTRTGFAYERVPKAEVEELILEEVPDIDYSDIGGLKSQIEAIRDAVELPFLHPDLFAEHGLKAPKGILLYGPPGSGPPRAARRWSAPASWRPPWR